MPRHDDRLNENPTMARPGCNFPAVNLFIGIEGGPQARYAQFYYRPSSPLCSSPLARSGLHDLLL